MPLHKALAILPLEGGGKFHFEHVKKNRTGTSAHF